MYVKTVKVGKNFNIAYAPEALMPGRGRTWQL